MKIFFSVLIFTVSIHLNAQLTVERSLNLDSGAFSALSEYGTNDYDGYPFLYEEWRNVNVITHSGDEIPADEGKLDIWQHKLIVVKKDLTIAVNNHQIAAIEISDLEGNTETFVKVGLNNELRFAKLLKSGEIKLFEIPIKNFKKPGLGEKSSGYNKEPRPAFSNAIKRLYVSVNDEELVELKTSKKGFVKSFPEEHKSKISKSLKSQKPNLKDATELIAFLGGIEEIL